MLGETPAQVRVQLPTTTAQIYHGQRLCPVQDLPTRTALTAAYTAFQTALTAFATAITAGGRYDQQAATARSQDRALTALTPTVIQIPGPLGTGGARCYNPFHIPRPLRLRALTPTAKMLRVQALTGSPISWAVQQRSVFCCPSDDTWTALLAVRDHAVAQGQAWQAALSAQGDYPHHTRRVAPAPAGLRRLIRAEEGHR